MREVNPAVMAILLIMSIVFVKALVPEDWLKKDLMKGAHPGSAALCTMMMYVLKKIVEAKT